MFRNAKLAGISACLVVLLEFTAGAQQSRLDSVVRYIEKMNVSKGVDTFSFEAAMVQLEITVLSDSNISLLEKKAKQLDTGDDDYWDYRVRFSILNSLIARDKIKALAYGKDNFESSKKSKSPAAADISGAFFRQLRIPYRTSNMLGEGFKYFNEKLQGYQLANDSFGMANCYYVLGGFYRTTGLMDLAIYNMKKCISYMDTTQGADHSAFPFLKPLGRNSMFNDIGVVALYYLQAGDYEESIKYSRIGLNELYKNKTIVIGNIPNYLAQALLLSGRLDSVLYFIDFGVHYKQNMVQSDFITSGLLVKAQYMLTIGDLKSAEELIAEAWQSIEKYNIPANAKSGTIAPDYYLALVRIKQNRPGDAIELLQKDMARLNGIRLDMLRDYKLMASLYEGMGNDKGAARAYKSYVLLQDSLQDDRNKYRTQSFETEQEINKNSLAIARLQSENKIAALTKYFSIGIALLVLLLAAFIYSRFKSKQKDNKILESTLQNLKATQNQLVQSEKMASLGELTAGIAHEIQNPLNFVNNFSDVNRELLEDLKQEADKGNLDEVKSIAGDIMINEEKINHHGKRADAIVKGMLQHSRSSTGQRQQTDVNALADEYLRLSYHGFRAKEHLFNATIKTDFDENAGEIDIVPQDVGRVFLNLLNNAFYAVYEKKKQFPEKYEPTVTVSTKKNGNQVTISVSDNGRGIPPNIVSKIFQPFFTTKPTGQGTGLGLSLSYDIIKAHGGELVLETGADYETVFKISLPA